MNLRSMRKAMIHKVIAKTSNAKPTTEQMPPSPIATRPAVRLCSLHDFALVCFQTM